MITVHHLRFSRSTRVLWLLEELGEPYEMVDYDRDPKTFRAPAALKQAHPLGKAPVIEIDGKPIAESGAILEYLAGTLGGGRLARSAGDADWSEYLEWMHFGEGTAMMGVIISMLTPPDSKDRAALYGREVAGTAMDVIEATLAGQEYLLASGFSAADIHNAYVAASAERFGLIEGRPNLRAWLDRVTARDAFKAAIEKGGSWTLDPANRNR